MAEILPKNKNKNATGSEILSGLISDKGLNTNVTVDIPIKTIIIFVAGVVAAVSLSVVAAHYIKKAVNK